MALKYVRRLRRRGLFCLVIGGWLLLGHGARLAAENGDAKAPLGLRGRVFNDEGLGQASIQVSIATAKPRTGPGYLCPSCYVDCGKMALSDADGWFEIPDLDPGLLFELLLVGDGFLAKFAPNIDPLNGDVEFTLERFDRNRIPSNRLFEGCVINLWDEPIAGAVITVHGWTKGEGTTWGPARRVMVTPVAVTDAHGRFTLAAKEDLTALQIKISGRNYAHSEFYDLSLESPPLDFRLVQGGTLSGRLMHQGKPLPGKTIEVASSNRSVRANFTRSSVPTDREGRFTFFNMPTGLVYQVTASMDSIRYLGKTPIKSIGPLKDGDTRDLGDLVIEPGLTIAGKVMTNDERPIPDDSVIIFGHRKVWGGQTKTLPPDGVFKFESLHPGKIKISLRAPGYRLASCNRSFSGLNRGELLATLSKSVTGLVILLEPGEWLEEPPRPDFFAGEDVQSRPLRGVEPLPRSEQAASILVEVHDQDSGQRLSAYRITPGWLFDGGTDPVWHPYQQVEVSGKTTQAVTLAKRGGQAFICVEADGYLPVSHQIEGQFGKQLDVALRTGSGLRGQVLGPDGEAVVKAQILMTKRWPNSDRPYLVFLEGDYFRWDTVRQHEVAQSDPSGRFEFSARETVRPIIAVHSSGYAEVREPLLGKPLIIQLQPWATIEGTVRDVDMSKLKLRINRLTPLETLKPTSSIVGHILNFFGYDDRRTHGNFWDFVLVEPVATYEDKGYFRLEKVPPGRWLVNLMRFVPRGECPGEFLGESVWAAKVTAKAAETATIVLASQ
ncbi:MAG: hypothetical protein M2R45_01836 [Verrucomicrobia subdivision 3 bacterium]|nr:hypothetical protein [Limisphaerales bacterium]MCS1415636.1 hypothetical protein [Limisphaerales bacterium]